tara:strand:- start:1538 stop:1714 length:177 start_codon:yes stop_codon:yes gene_type:complete
VVLLIILWLLVVAVEDKKVVAAVPVALEVVIQTFHHPIREVPSLLLLIHIQSPLVLVE